MELNPIRALNEFAQCSIGIHDMTALLDPHPELKYLYLARVSRGDAHRSAPYHEDLMVWLLRNVVSPSIRRRLFKQRQQQKEAVTTPMGALKQSTTMATLSERQVNSFSLSLCLYALLRQIS